MKRPRRASVSYDVRSGTWELTEDYLIELPGFTAVIPAGYRFDLASVPRPLWRFIGPHELGIVAPLVHDVLYAYRGALPASWGSTGRCTRLRVDRIFLDLMRADGVPRWKRWVAYRAVRLFGWIYWRT